MDNQPIQPIKPTKDKSLTTKQKKTLIYAGMAIIAIAILTVATIFVVNKLNTEEVVVTIETANELKTDAIEALKADNDEVAKDLFEQAREEYVELGDTNNVIDTEAQLYLLEHAN